MLMTERVGIQSQEAQLAHEARLIHLIKEARQNNSQAFEQITRPYKNLIYKIVRQRLSNEQDVEDVVQITFLHAFHKLDTLREDTNFKAWLSKIALNAARTFHRDRKTREKKISTVQTDEQSDILENIAETTPLEQSAKEDTAEEIELYQLAKQHIKNQDALQAFILFYEGGISQAEIAEQFGWILPTTKTNIHRAKRALEAEMERLRQLPKTQRKDS